MLEEFNKVFDMLTHLRSQYSKSDRILKLSEKEHRNLNKDYEAAHEALYKLLMANKGKND